MTSETRMCLRSYTSLQVANLTQEEDTGPGYPNHRIYPQAALEPPHKEETLHEQLQCLSWEPPQPHLQDKHLFHPQGQPPLVHWEMHLCYHHNQYPNQEWLHPKISLDHSHNLSLSLLQYQNPTVDRHDEPPFRTHPQVTIRCQTTELSLSKDILQAKVRTKPKAWVNPLCVSDVAETTIQNITAKTAKFPADIARARCMPPIAVHSFWKPHLHQMVRHHQWMKPVNMLTKFTPQAEEEVQEPGQTKKGTYTETTGPAKWQWCLHSTTPGEQKCTASTTRATTAFLPTTPTTGIPAWPDHGPARPQHCCCTQTDGSVTSATLWDQPNSDKSPWEHCQCLIVHVHIRLYPNLWQQRQGCMYWMVAKM